MGNGIILSGNFSFAEYDIVDSVSFGQPFERSPIFTKVNKLLGDSVEVPCCECEVGFVELLGVSGGKKGIASL